MKQTVKSNPYVYPYVPFEELSNKSFKDNFMPKKVCSWADVRKLVSNIRHPEPRILGDSIEEKIFTIFLDDRYRFGPKEYLVDNKADWLSKFRNFTDKGEVIQFTLLGFPFKVPLILKTGRKLPDMGDVLALTRLKIIVDIIKSVYEPGAVVNVFTEGAFGEFVGVSDLDIQGYTDFLEEMNTELGYEESVKFIDLGELRKKEDFDERYQEKINELKLKYVNRDEDFLKKYKGAYDSLYRIVRPIELPIESLMDVYNDDISDDDATDKVRNVRKYLKDKTHDALFKYYAFLLLRDDYNFVQEKVPNGIPLSVSPKSNRLGIVQVNEFCKRLPHHGVTVYDPKEDKYLIEYLLDLQRMDGFFEPVYLKGDKEDEPFYYIKH